MSSNSIEKYFAQLPDDTERINVVSIVSIQTHYLPDLSRFYKLTSLDCSNNQLTQLPTLPPTLKYFSCRNNQLTQLPTLPPTLKNLDCNNNQLTQLPTLPPTLEILDCSTNQLRQLPTLPPTLECLSCSTNQLTQLPTLPPRFEYLVCNENQLTQLPTLPPTLDCLYCNKNQLRQLPTLPSILTHLICNNNQLTQLPTLPCILIHLDCRNNLLPFDHERKDPNMMEYIIQMRNKNNIFIRFKELFYDLKYKKLFRDWLWVRIREPKIRNKYHPDNLIKLLESPENLTLYELDELYDNW